jgi:hypothetical protein
VGDDCWVFVLPYFLSRNNTFKATAYGKGMVSSEMDTLLRLQGGGQEAVQPLDSL